MAEPEGILIVEDNADDIFFLQRGMSKARLSEPVTFVCDGRGALQYLAASEDRSDWSLPKLILLDLSLPELSGLRVLEWLRGQARFKDIPVVVFTGMADPAYLTRAVALGAARCYTKNPEVCNWDVMLGELAQQFGLRTVARRAELLEAVQAV